MGATSGHPLIILDSATRPLFCIGVGESFAIPDGISVTSPTSQYQPATVAGTFNDIRPTAGGQTLVYLSDAAGSGKATEFEVELFPGDTISLSAVVSNTVTISVINSAPGSVSRVVGQITGVTTVAFLVGLYG